MPRLYCVVYQFANNEESTRAWEQIRDVLENAEDLSLSCYNMQLISNQQWYVALVGKLPSKSRQEQLKKLCEGGTQVSLSDSEIVKLTQKRLEGSQEGSWVIKRHKKPGKYI